MKARRLVLVGQTRSVYIFLTPSLRTKRLTRRKTNKQLTYLFALIENSNVKFDYNVCTTTVAVYHSFHYRRHMNNYFHYRRHVNNYFLYHRRVPLLPTTIVNDYTA